MEAVNRSRFTLALPPRSVPFPFLAPPFDLPPLALVFVLLPPPSDRPASPSTGSVDHEELYTSDDDVVSSSAPVNGVPRSFAWTSARHFSTAARLAPSQWG